MSSEPAAFSGTAPGKVILFGEHAVVYGEPAIAAPVNEVEARAVLRPARGRGHHFTSSATGLDRLLDEVDPEFWGSAVLEGLRAAAGAGIPGFHLEIVSTIPVASGLGSGAAVAVAAIRAIAAYTGLELDNDQVSDIAFRAEQIHHGTPSGIDNTVISRGEMILFRAGRSFEPVKARIPLQILIADTGMPGLTHETVRDVREGRERDPAHFNPPIEAIGALTSSAKSAIEAGRLDEVGDLMLENQRLLKSIGVSSPVLERLVKTAVGAGALGAKLSGGGRGGNMVALVEDPAAARVAEALREAGAVRVIDTHIK